MKLYGYFRSSAAFRVRIALNLKGLAYDNVFIHLRKGEEFAQDYLRLNPQGIVPTLEDGSHVLTQSLAIIEYLEETYPEPALLPKKPSERARIRALALAIACEIHPLNNLRVLEYLKSVFKVTPEQQEAWYKHWIADGFKAFEQMLAGGDTDQFCHGDTPGLGDVCLVPQVFNARRFNCPLDDYPMLMRVFNECMQLDAFDRAQPSKQADAE